MRKTFWVGAFLRQILRISLNVRQSTSRSILESSSKSIQPKKSSLRVGAFTLLELLIAAAITSSLAVVTTTTLSSVAQAYIAVHKEQENVTTTQNLINQMQRDIESSTIEPIVAANSEQAENGIASAVFLVAVAGRDTNGEPTDLPEYRVYCTKLTSDGENIMIRFAIDATGVVSSSPPTTLYCTSQGVAAFFDNTVDPFRQELTSNTLHITSFQMWPIQSADESQAGGYRLELAGRFWSTSEVVGAETRSSDNQLGPRQFSSRAIALRNQPYSITP